MKNINVPGNMNARTQRKRKPTLPLRKRFKPLLILCLMSPILACTILNPVSTSTPVPFTATISSTVTPMQVQSTPTLPEATVSPPLTEIPLPILFSRLEVINATNVAKLQPIADLSVSGVWRTAFSPDGKKLAVGLSNGVVEIWDLTSGQLSLRLEGHDTSRSYNPNRMVEYLSFSPDGGLLLSRAEYKPAANDAVIIWDLSGGQKIRTLDEIRAAISPDWRVLATEPLDSNSSIIKLTDFKTNDQLGTLNDPSNSIMDISFSPDGQTLTMMLVGVDNASIIVWDVPSRKTLANLDEMLKLVFSPDGKFAAGGSWHPFMHIFETKTWTEIASLSGNKDLDFNSPLFTPDGSMVAGSFGEEINLFETGTWKELATLSSPGASHGFTFSPDGRMMVSYDWGGTVLRLWGVVP